jgi:HEAT repeat protein
LDQQAESVDPFEDVLQQSFQQASGLLDSLNAYANALSARGADGNLKAIYPLLEGLEQQVGGLKQGATSLEATHAGLASLINELEVLTTTEKFKFNRGDYV